jgi:hypothetical protein
MLLFFNLYYLLAIIITTFQTHPVGKLRLLTLGTNGVLRGSQLLVSPAFIPLGLRGLSLG